MMLDNEILLLQTIPARPRTAAVTTVLCVCLIPAVRAWSVIHTSENDCNDYFCEDTQIQHLIGGLCHVMRAQDGGLSQQSDGRAPENNNGAASSSSNEEYDGEFHCSCT